MKTVALFTAMLVIVVALSYLYYSLAVEDAGSFEEELLLGIAAGSAGRGGIAAVEGVSARVGEKATTQVAERVGAKSVSHAGLKAAGKVGFHAVEKLSVRTLGQAGFQIFERGGIAALEAAGGAGAQSVLRSFLVTVGEVLFVVLPRRLSAFIRHAWGALLFLFGLGFVVRVLRSTRYERQAPSTHESIGTVVASILLLSILFTVVFSRGEPTLSFWLFALAATTLAIGVHKLGHLAAARFFGTRISFELCKSSTAVVTAVSLGLHDFFAAVGHVTFRDALPVKHRVAVIMAGTYGNLMLFSLCCFVIPLGGSLGALAYLAAIISMAYAIDNLFPLAPMEGHHLFAYNKRLWILTTAPLWVIFFGYFSPH